MYRFFERYQQGLCQEVYDELLMMGETIHESSVYDDACDVAHEMMRRVRYNLEEILLPRLKQMGYRFGDGSWDYDDGLSDEELARIQEVEPIFQAATDKDEEAVAELEQLVGTLPLSLKYFYMVVGSINLIGSFPSSQAEQPDLNQSGYGLDPLFTQPLQSVIDEVCFSPCKDEETGVSIVPLSPDSDLKYGVSGGGDYEIRVPCTSFDTLLEGEEHHLTFVNYLRLCFRWGGFPGLETSLRLTQDELHFLTKDLIVF